MRFYADENFPLPVVAELRGLGHDVLTAFEDGRAHQAVADENVLLRSTSLERVLLTIDRIDFLRLHNAGKPHTGIILCTFDVDFARQADRIHRSSLGSRELSGKLIRVNRPN
jgi:hypothetical protein